MCVFNGLEDTRACLESLRATTEPFRLVVMDNGSTDGTTEFFTRFPYPYPLTFARSPANDGVTAALNRAWRLADTEVLCFLHNDTELSEPAWLARLLEALAEPRAGLAGVYGAKRLRADGRAVGRTIVSSLLPAPTVRAPREDVAFVDSVCMCLPRDLMQTVGGFDEGYGFYHGHDRDLSLAVLERGRRCLVVLAPFRHHGGRTRPRDFARDPPQERAPLAIPDAGPATMPLLRIGIVGVRFAAELHAVNYRPLVGSKVELAAVCARTRSQAEAFAKHHAVARVFTDYRELCASPHVDVVDICSTTDTHHEVAIAAARAGKHVIVEKPLTGAFCEATEPREAMRAAALRNSDAVLDAVTSAGVTLCYAEDFVYAPPVAKLRRLLDASGGAILELRAEESHGGSHAAYAARWRTSGGGSLLRMGSHPVGVVLHLKHSEGLRRHGRPIRARTVLADVAQLTRLPTVAQERRYLATKAEDVEDWAVAVITFEDGTKATVHSNDTTLGGVRNVVTAYLTNGVIHANINPNTTVAAYAPDGAVWGDEYITEKVETKAGWQFPSPEEDWMRGYPQELADFVDAIRERREPLAGALLAREVVEVIYAGYVSAENGRRVELGRA